MGSLELDTTERLHFHFSRIGEGNGNSLRVLAWRIPGRDAWLAAVYGVTQSDTTEAMQQQQHIEDQ